MPESELCLRASSAQAKRGGLSEVTRSLDFYHFRIGLTERELIASYRYLNRISERSDFSHIDLNTLGNAHVHDPALYRALSAELYDLYGLAHFDFL